MQWYAQVGLQELYEHLYGSETTERNGEIMSEFEIHRATRRRAKLRLGMSGPAGSGKTYSALLIASGLGGRVGMIDTEHGSGDLYADLLAEGYDILRLAPPFTPGRYIEAIHALEQAGVNTIIIDSLTHAWSGEGGSLDRQGKIADRSGNSWQAWRQVTPEHNALVEAMLQSRCHVIATMRAKTEYVQEKDERTGRQVVRKIGLAPIMRDGIDYEFTIFMELNAQHMAYVGKDRTRLFDGQILQPDAEVGRRLLAWLESGTDEEAPAALDDRQKAVFAEAIGGARDLDELYREFAVAYRAANALSDVVAVAELTRLKDARKAELEAAVDEIFSAHA